MAFKAVVSPLLCILAFLEKIVSGLAYDSQIGAVQNRDLFRIFNKSFQFPRHFVGQLPMGWLARLALCCQFWQGCDANSGISLVQSLDGNGGKMWTALHKIWETGNAK